MALLHDPHVALSSGTPDTQVVAFERGAQHPLAALRARVETVRARVSGPQDGAWLLYCENALAFAAGYLGVLAAGGELLLPPNCEPGTLARLRGELAGAVMDTPAEALEGTARIDPGIPSAGAQAAPAAIASDRACIALSTSGTTGPGQRIAKTPAQLAAEVPELEAQFGARLGDARIYASVTPQHIYGLLFRVLWPLAAGRPFQADPTLHVEELLPRLAAEESFALVSTPAHLRRLVAAPELAGLAPRCRAVFSSGGPLPAETAHAVEAALGAPPVEVFGSTETGGIAWRQQHAADAESLWTPFAPVRLEVGDGGRLVVTSPFVSGGEPADEGRRCFVTGDHAELESDGRFRLQGRVDRVLKIGEKRLSLPEMERQLCAHPLVDEAALAPFDPGSGNRVGAVVVLSAPGRRALAEEGRRALSRTLGAQLAPFWDRVLLPRAWRYVDALPRNAQGKLAQTALAAMLRELTPRPRVAPEALSEAADAAFLERRARVPVDLAFLEGHYDRAPIVAGVVQLEWVIRAVEAWLGAPPRLRALEGVKFKEVLRPGQAFTLRVERAATDRLEFRLSDGEHVFSEGRLRVRPAPEVAA